MSGLRKLLDLEKTPFARPYSDADYDLPRYRAWVDSLGSPDRGMAFLHIAGTKGKGSTAAMCESILRAHGLRTGMYTSPHLEHLGERFRIDGVPYTLDELNAASEAFERDYPSATAPSHETGDFRTVFECLTALALVEFKRQRVDAVVWETGLGGRLDCTNIVDPRVCAITAIARDHTKLLGDSIASIAREKAGIIKPGRPVVVQRQPFPEALAVLEARAKEVGAPLHRAESMCEVISARATHEGLQMTARLPDGSTVDCSLPLHGAHQARNFETAVAASWDFLIGTAMAPDPEKFVRGVESVRWPGRLEILAGMERLLVLDGAHCPLSAACLAEALREWRDVPGAPHGPFAVVLGMQSDKEIAGFCKSLAASGLIAKAECYTVPGGRGAEAHVVAEAARNAGIPATVHHSPDAALAAALASGLPVVSTGTLYTIAAFAAQFHAPK